MLPLAFATFLAFGYLLVVIGASQAGLATDLGLDLQQFGLLGATFALGLGGGVFASGPIVDRFPRRPIFMGATLVCAIAMGSMSREMTLLRALVHVVAFGFGGGVFDTLLNTLVLERFRERSARPLAALHGAATLGAVLTPPLVGWFTTSSGHWTTAFHAGAAMFSALAIWILLIPLDSPPRSTRLAGDRGPAPRDLRWLPAVFGLCIVGFAYVGVENGLTLFAVPYASGALGLPEASGRESISAFWLGLLLARIVLAMYRGPTGPRGLIAMGIAGAVVVAAGVATGWPQVWIWTLAVGLCLGGVFPLMVTQTGERAPHAVGRATSVVIGVACLGGFAVPWAAGALGDRLGVSTAVGCLAVACLVLAAGAWASRMPPLQQSNPPLG